MFTKQLASIALLSLALVPFQNCGKFETMEMASLDLGSENFANRFEAAKQVIQTNCTACHYPGATSGNLLFETEAEYRSAQLVTPGSISTSKLITRLRNYTAPIDGRNMPPTGPISAQDFATLTAWVSGMELPGGTDIFTCTPGEGASTLDARRLSKTELRNSLRRILVRPFGTTEADQILTGAAAAFDRIPNDSRAPFSRSDRAFESGHADGQFELAEALATAMTNSARYSRLVTTYVNYAPGNCTSLNTASLSTACRDAFINNFLLRLWGRPLESGSTELTNFQAEFGGGISSTEAVNNFVFRALLSPQFQNHIYTDITATGSSGVLSSFAIARRLSYHFQLAGLDEDLIRMAQTTDLRDDTNFALALNHVSQTPTAMLQDFADDWLKLHRISGIATPNTPKFNHVSSGIAVNSALRSAMRQELLDFVTYIYQAGRPVQDLITSNVSLARQADLMRIYGQTTAAPATFNETTAVRLPAAERAGIMTRAGYLYYSGESERPVIRGVHVMADFLCAEVKGQVPAEAAMTPIPEGLFTTREKYEQITSSSSCSGCHSQINPVGNAFSSYNAFGGYQAMEPVFVNGTFRQNLATDARVNLQATLHENVTVQGGVEFSQWIARSNHFRACFSRQYQAYTQRLSTLPTATNSCDMQRMSEVISNNGSLVDFLRAPATGVEFRRRNLVQ